MYVSFPSYTSQRYYHSHYEYVLHLLRASDKATIVLEQMEELSEGTFVCKINDKRVYFCFSDDFSIYYRNTSDCVFKFHYSESIKYEKNVHPFSPISFNSWEKYFSFVDQIHYFCTNDLVLNNQREYGNAIERRRHVKKTLVEKYNALVDFSISTELSFFLKINNCLASVCVPGYCNNMLDRGQFQFIAFGACTISPHLNNVLSHNQTLLPGIHYIQCKDDYSDLISKIEWCKKNRGACMQIGNNAKNLFLKTSTPSAVGSYIEMFV
jgi:hypothetical protein